MREVNYPVKQDKLNLEELNNDMIIGLEWNSKTITQGKSQIIRIADKSYCAIEIGVPNNFIYGTSVSIQDAIKKSKPNRVVVLDNKQEFLRWLLEEPETIS